MRRISKCFELLQSKNEKALVAFLTAGDPDLASTKDLFKVVEENGADIIELGVPFSDPLADGPVIQASSQRSLKSGTTLKKIIQLVQDIRQTSQLPIVLMTSFNPVFVYGLDQFVNDAVQAGVDGVIVPDLPLEEAEDFNALADSRGLDMIFLLAPTSTPERVDRTARQSKGFIYYISVTGVTGVRVSLAEGLEKKMKRVKQATPLPVLIGFGISEPEQAQQASQISDGVIVGSALVKIVAQYKDAKERNNRLGALVKEMKQALQNGQ